MKNVETLPKLLWEPTTAFSSRNGVKPTLLVIHRWAGGSFDSVVQMFKDSPHGATGKSAHFVYAGEAGKDAGKLAQMVSIEHKAWTQATWNPHCISIECADDIFIGNDLNGLRRLGRIIAGICHYESIRPDWVTRTLLYEPNGFTRHGDLGVLGGNHPLCPTTDIPQWVTLSTIVNDEFRKGGFRTREAWGLR